MERDEGTDDVLSALVARTAAQERAHLARDLHDTLGQELWTLGLELDRLAEAAPDGMADRLRGLSTAMDEARRGLRCRLHRLRAAALDGRSLAGALTDLDRDLRGRGAAGLALHLPTADRRAPAAVEDQLWCVVLEAVANALRHGEPVPVEVHWTLDPRTDGALLLVANLCRPQPSDHDEGLGRASMAARAIALGGTLRAGRVEPDRWEVCAEVPCCRPGSTTQARLPLDLPAA